MSDTSPETVIALLTRDIEQLKEHQAVQDKLISDMRAERDNALKWGIVVLGGMVVSMITWAINVAKDHVK